MTTIAKTHLEEVHDIAVLDSLTKRIRQNLFKDIESLASGGGYNHLFLQLHDGRIISLHLTDGICEISYLSWPTITAYIEAGYDYKAGFGYEPEKPDYPARQRDSLAQWESLLPTAPAAQPELVVPAPTHYDILRKALEDIGMPHVAERHNDGSYTIVIAADDQAVEAFEKNPTSYPEGPSFNFNIHGVWADSFL